MKTYDKENKKPVIKASICNGEQVAGFKDIHTGKIEEVMLIKNKEDLDAFKKMYGIDGEIDICVDLWWVVVWTVVGFGRSDMLYNNYWNSFRKAVFQNC